MAKSKKKDEKPESGPVDPDVAEFLANKSEDAQQLDTYSPEEYQRQRAARIWSFDDTGHDLTVDQALFCRSYIIDRNPVAALKRLNYVEDNKKLKAVATRYLENTEVRDCIEALAKQLMERLAITAENVNARIAAVAFFDPRSVLEFDHHSVKVKHSRFWTKDEVAAIQSIKVGQHGVELKLHDGLRAAEMLGKQLGTLKDDSEEARSLGAKAAAEEVIGTIMDIFDKTREQRRLEHQPVMIDVTPEPTPVPVPE